MKYIARFMLFVLLIAGSASAVAQEKPDFDTEVLRSIDTVPTRQQLDSTWPDARTRLMQAAADQERNVYERHRAISLLSRYPDPQTRTFLQDLASDANVEIRKMAVYSVARTFGVPGDANLVSFVEGHLNDDSAEVQEWAVRSLRWIQHEDARKLLEKVVTGDDEKLKRLARRALEKRTDQASRTR